MNERMMTEMDVWPVFVDAYHAISRYYVPVMDEKAAEYQLPEGGGWHLLPALTFDPDPISAEILRVRSPYTSAQRYQADLVELAAQGFLVLDAGMIDAYRLSPVGRQAILAVIQAGYDCMESLTPLNPAELETLANKLLRLVNACLNASEPPGKWSITHSRKIDPDEKAGVMVRIDQYLSDLAAYRDDSHLAAWQIHDIDGHAWEAMTILWREGPVSLEDLAEKLSRRGFSQSDYQDALEGLVEQGWVSYEQHAYCLTALGKEVRNAAEADTDRFFYRPWSCLSEQAFSLLLGQINSLRDALQAGC